MELPPKHSRLFGYSNARGCGVASLKHSQLFGYRSIGSILATSFWHGVMWGRGELGVGGLMLGGRAGGMVGEASSLLPSWRPQASVP